MRLTYVDVDGAHVDIDMLDFHTVGERFNCDNLYYKHPHIDYVESSEAGNHYGVISSDVEAHFLALEIFLVELGGKKNEVSHP